jgi:protein-S-isoprenylcysteine O-methyltransferase Ste14
VTWLQGLRVPPWLALILDTIGVTAAHAVAPWALSLTAARHGWMEGWPGIWNLAGLVPVAAGFCVFIWCLRCHFQAAPQGWRIEKTPHFPTPDYLLTEGPYRYSRNPIYLAELAVWLGWIVFYGSLVVLGVFTAAALALGPVILPREERGLEARFGDAYRDYCRKTPRLLGKVRR